VPREIPSAFAFTLAFAAIGGLAGCGPAQPPESLRQLESIQDKIAMTSLREQRAREQLEAAGEVESQRELEIGRLTSAIAAMERMLTRDRVRRHVEAVVDAGRRRAAEAEAQRGADAALGGARLEIGREMLARSRVEAAVLGALVAAGAALEEQRAAADGAVALAEQALGREDLAAVQERVEEIGVAAHRAFAWAFEGAQKAPAARIAEMVERLEAAGVDAVPDEYGAAVSLAGAGKKGKQAACRSAGRLAEIDAALKEAPKHAVISIATLDARPFPALDTGKRKCPVALVVPLPDSP
jgi:hypothetical protein